ncbi:MAG TPA: TetR/AcrR family transcriptional regulator [Actinomycetota bacterium]
MTTRRKTGKKTETDTRERILDAAMETLRAEGFTRTTAREIARRGAFNQALIFYHFGSVQKLLLEAFRTTSSAQVATYKAAAAEVSSLSDLVAIARRLHDDDVQSGTVTAVTQLMAASIGDPAVGDSILDRFEEWIELVQDALTSALAGHPIAAQVPAREAAYAISALFLGIELMTRLDPERSEADKVFEMMSSVATLIEAFLPALSPQQSSIAASTLQRFQIEGEGSG